MTSSNDQWVNFIDRYTKLDEENSELKKEVARLTLDANKWRDHEREVQSALLSHLEMTRQ
jgi:hypothetical protein